MKDAQYIINPRTNAVTIHLIDGRPVVSVECEDKSKARELQDYARKILPLLPAPEPRKPKEFMVLCDDEGRPANGSIVGARWYKFREVLDGT